MHPQIATPISTLFTNSSQMSLVLDLSDALELRKLSPPISSPLPRLYHCELSIADQWTKKEIREIAKFIQEHKVSLVSFHIMSCFERAPLVGGKFQPRGQKMSDTEMLKHVASNISALRDLVGPITFAVENNNYFPTGAYESVTEPKFINQVLRAGGLFLLLDIGHAEISAHNLNKPFREFIQAFNLQLVKQIHLSGIDRKNDIYEDTHLSLTSEDWKNFDEVALLCPALKYVTIEYYQDARTLVEMLKKLKKHLDELSR